jgi:hypothetical protein
MRILRLAQSIVLVMLVLVSGAFAQADPSIRPEGKHRAGWTRLPPDARKQEFAKGTESLRWVLKDANLEAVSRVSELVGDPGHTILIVLGNLDWLEDSRNIPESPGSPGGLGAFLNNGGALLAASDRHSQDTLRNWSAATVVGKKLIYPGHPKDKCHLEQSDRPFVVPVGEGWRGSGDNPFTGLRRVATNLPSYLQLRQTEGIDVLAQFPRGMLELWPELPPIRPRQLEPLPFAVGKVFNDNGRLLLMADHSVFINEMMLTYDSDNLDFTLECLNWLGAGAGGQRTKAMLVEDTHIHETFDVQLRQIPSPPPLKVLEELFSRREEIAEEAQRRIAKVEKDNSINGSFLRSIGIRNGQAFGRVRRFLLWVIGGFVLAVVLYRLSNEGRHLPEKRLPLLATAVAGQRPNAVMIEQRPRAQLSAGNLWESAREFARHHLSASNEGPIPPPYPLVVGGSWRQRRQARQRLRQLWAVAYGPTPVRIPPKRWEAFLTQIDAFDRDVAQGTVKLPAV